MTLVGLKKFERYITKGALGMKIRISTWPEAYGLGSQSRKRNIVVS